MTGPTSGFADWQQYASWRSQLVYNQTVTVPAGGSLNILPIPVGNYASVRVYIVTNSNGAELVLYGDDDAGRNGQHIIKQWVARPNTRIHCLVPIPTAYIEATIFAEPAHDWNGTVIFQFSNVATDKVHYYGSQQVIGAFAQNINPGAHVVWYPPVLLPGPAHFWAATDAPPQDVVFSMRTYDSASVDQFFLADFRLITLTAANYDFIIPERAWRLDVFNNTAANRVYTFGVTSRGNMT